jgi:hypothetical protein
MKKLFVLFAVSALIVAFTVPAAAGDWKFYGSARVSIFTMDRDDGMGRSERDTYFQLQNNSRLGARVSGKKVSGRFEWGVSGDADQAQNWNVVNSANNFTAASGTDVYLRHLFGSWDFGGGRFVVGHTTTPEYLGISSGIHGRGSDSVMIGWGVPYFGRRALLQLEFGGFKIALVDPTAHSNLGEIDSTVLTTGVTVPATTELTIPKIAASYDFKFDPVKITLAGSYLNYNIERQAWSDLSVDAWYFGGRLDAMLGPVRLRGVAFVTQNANELAKTSRAADGAMVINSNTANAAVVDNEGWGWAITANYKLNDMISFEAGYGNEEYEMDDANMANATAPAGTTTGTTQEDDVAGYYLQCMIKMAPGVYIVPEIGVDDRKQSATGGEEGDNTYFGAKFQIDF